MNEKFKRLIPCLAVTALSVFLSLVFAVSVIGTGFLTAIISIIIAVALILLNALVFWLTTDYKREIRFAIGCILALILIFCETFGFYYVRTGVKTLNEITTPTVEHAEMGIYVRVADPATTLEEVRDYKFGILEALDRDATDMAIKNINGELESEISTTDFADLGALLDSLIKDKTMGAIILNKSFIDLLEETEGHQKDAEKIRALYSVIIEDDSSHGEAAPPFNETFTMYISGIDCRGSISRKSRSDVNIIATVNTKTRQVLLLSTPRDYYVPLSISKGVPDKLTHAGIYGINVSKDTLSMLYDTPIDYYFRVNFDGFEEIIDALGGIDVVSKYSFTSESYTFTKGVNTLDGKKALVFSRERYKIPTGDRGRGENQMAVIRAVIAKAASPALLKNYKKVMDSIAGSFETSVPYNAIAQLVQNQLKDNTRWNVTTYSVNGTGTSRPLYSVSGTAYVMIPDEETVEHAKELIEQVKNGEVPKP